MSRAGTTKLPNINNPSSSMSQSRPSTQILSQLQPIRTQSQRNEQITALKKIDQLSEKLQKEGKLLESLQCMERSLILRGHIFGLESVEVYRACKSVGEMCNYLAMTYLQQDQFDITLELLKKAEVLTERHKLVRAVTFNNLACYYRKKGKLRTALGYCRQAINIESKFGGNAKAADTHLNMCTILSELHRHDKAIIHARQALKLLLLELFGAVQQEDDQQEDTNKNSDAQGDDNGQNADGSNKTDGQNSGEEQDQGEKKESDGGNNGNNADSANQPKLPADRVAVLGIAYHNLAVQQEFLRRYSDSLVSYEKAVRVGLTHLGVSHPLVKSLYQSFYKAQSKLAKKIEKENKIKEKQSSKFVPDRRSVRNSQQYASTGSLGNLESSFNLSYQDTQLMQQSNADEPPDSLDVSTYSK